MTLHARHHRYWRRTLLFTAALLLIWFGVTFGVSYFARSLNFDFIGWPFSFWMGAQGAPLIYVLLIGFYAWRMNRADEAHERDTGLRD
jgi:putative solute:sodium symporter small subunit